MLTAERLVDIAERLPGYYGYRPVAIGEDVRIKELFFRIDDEEYHYNMSFYFDGSRCIDSTIDVRYSDGSIARLNENSKVFNDIIKHRDKLVHLFNKLE